MRYAVAVAFFVGFAICSSMGAELGPAHGGAAWGIAALPLLAGALFFGRRPRS